MARIADRVKDSTTTTGTGAVTLSGTAPTGYQTFSTAFGSGSTYVRYAIEGGAEWEVGTGTFNGTTTLTRDRVESSSDANALVSFSAGTKDVFCTASADMLDSSNLGTQMMIARGFALP